MSSNGCLSGIMLLAIATLVLGIGLLFVDVDGIFARQERMARMEANARIEEAQARERIAEANALADMAEANAAIAVASVMTPVVLVICLLFGLGFVLVYMARREIAFVILYGRRSLPQQSRHPRLEYPQQPKEEIAVTPDYLSASLAKYMNEYDHGR